MKLKIFIILMLTVAVITSRTIYKSGEMQNSDLIMEDSMYVDGTASAFSKAVAVDKGAHLSLVIEARDDSTAGFASDSACVSIELYQVIPDTRHDVERFQVFKSKAHPDSTYPGTDWYLFDSLHIADMDTLAIYDRGYIDDTIQTRVTRIWDDELDSVNTDIVYGALAYMDFAPDFTPAITFQLTGKADNLTDGTGSMWILRLYQMAGEPVETNE